MNRWITTLALSFAALGHARLWGRTQAHQQDDVVGSGYGPEHAGALQLSGDDGLAPGFD